MSTRDPRQFVRELIAEHPYLQSIYTDDLEDNNGELLPHLLMADICRWAVAERDSNALRVLQLLWWLEFQFETTQDGADPIDNVISASFIEHLPKPTEPGSDVALLLGPKMQARYERFFGRPPVNDRAEGTGTLDLRNPGTTVRDLSFLAPDLQIGARCDPNGEVSWPASQAPAVIRALADSGSLVLGLDIRDYKSDGSFVEVPWWSYAGTDVQEASLLAVEVLGRGNIPGGWVLITW